MNVFVLTRSNSWSNYAFVFFGLLEISIAIRDLIIMNEIFQLPMTSMVRKHPEWLLCHGIILMYGGAGSFAFHASYTHLGHKLDITGVFMMLAFPACCAVVNIFYGKSTPDAIN